MRAAARRAPPGGCVALRARTPRSWVVGLAGVSWLTFTSVSFLEVKRKYEGDDWLKPAPPPPQKAASPPAPAPPPPADAQPKPRGFKRSGGK